ncbi:MAG: hypothetical protein IJX84_12475 [Clostridia bacterium]|nr:hypothetical protein [Clostridia bacterium]
MKECREDLAKKMEEYLHRMEQLHLTEYLAYVSDRRRLMRSHFLGGLARGVGMAIGFTVLGAVLVILLRHLAEQNLPLIGDFLAQIVTVVQRRLE